MICFGFECFDFFLKGIDPVHEHADCDCESKC